MAAVPVFREVSITNKTNNKRLLCRVYPSGSAVNVPAFNALRQLMLSQNSSIGIPDFIDFSPNNSDNNSKVTNSGTNDDNNQTMNNKGIPMAVSHFITEGWNPILPGKTVKFGVQGQLQFISCIANDGKILKSNFNTLGSTFEYDGVSLDEVQLNAAQLQITKNIFPIANGIYVFECVQSRKVWDIEGGSTNAGAKLIQWDYHGGDNQKFELKQLNNGYYSIKCVKSGLFLDIAGGSTSNNAKVHQWKWHGGNNQQFEFIDTGNGRYRIKARHSGKSFDVEGGSTNGGAKVMQYQWHGGNNQLFICKK